jgi:hypothetical protein
MVLPSNLILIVKSIAGVIQALMTISACTKRDKTYIKYEFM